MISPIYNNGIISQTQNVNIINNNQENKNAINYQQTQVNVEHNTEEQHTTVVASQDSNQTNTHHDARDEGRNKYFDMRKKKPKPGGADGGNADGVVVKKTPGGFTASV